ncbi:hypothetical protein GE061_001709 [Apolygus lucorum]|uniref:Ion transport domain-containing protein n=1 Tax=Apolygus lucorum TaxID=248454 RepID=A0A8S9YGA1_APOLU|nr:hypothetical protein GE061_001709 [Apolygus lucorum]
MAEFVDLENACVWMDQICGEKEGRNRRKNDNYWRNNLNPEFLNAVIQGDWDLANKWLKYGASVHAKSSETGNGAVHFAATFGDDSILRNLLQMGASPSPKNKVGLEPIHVAIWHARAGAVKVLSETTPTVVNSIVNPEEACHTWDSEACNIKNEPTLIEIEFEVGTTPLHMASMKNLHYIMELLIYKGANSELRTSITRSSPLDIVGTNAENPKDSEAAFRIAYNTLIQNTKLTLPRVDEWYQDGRCVSVERATTALHTAVRHEYLTAIEDLLSIGACCGVWDADNENPLTAAVTNNSVKSLLVLLKWHKKNKTPKPQVNARNSLGFTPLHAALHAGKPSIVAILLQGDADATLTTFVKSDFFVFGPWNSSSEYFVYSKEEKKINTKSVLELTTCCLAVMGKNVECVEMLSWDSDALDYELANNINMLHLAAWTNSPEITRFLIYKYKERKSGNVDVLKKKVDQLCDKGAGFNGYRMAPIHCATYHKANTLETIRVLIEEGECNVKLPAESRDYGDTTALQFATMQGKWENIHLIFKHDKEALHKKAKKRKGDRQLLLLPHTAAVYDHHEVLRQYLLNGADLSSVAVDGNREFTLVDVIEICVYDYVNYLQGIFDEFIDVENYDSERCSVVLNYGILDPGREQKSGNQMKVFEALVSDETVGVRQVLLLHPLTQTFLYLKWQKLKLIFHLVVACHLMMAVLITALGYIRHVHDQTRDLASDYFVAVPLRSLLGLLTIIMMCFKIVTVGDTILFHGVSRVPLIRTAMSLALIFSCYLMVSFHGSHWWQKEVSALAILLSWAELLYFLARYPWSGKYPSGMHYVMFLTVANHFVKVTFSFSLLIMAFALSFLILGYDKNVDSSFFRSVVKSMTMATEFDRDIIFENNSTDTGSLVNDFVGNIGNLLYSAFFIIITIAMVNFMTGVAIGDISALQNEGKARQIFEQAQVLASFERILKNAIETRVCRKLEVFLKDGLQNDNQAIPQEMAVAVNERVTVIIQKMKKKTRS